MSALSLSGGEKNIDHEVKTTVQESKLSVAVDAFTHFRHLLLPMTDQDSYLSEGTRQHGHATIMTRPWCSMDIHNNTMPLHEYPWQGSVTFVAGHVPFGRSKGLCHGMPVVLESRWWHAFRIVRVNLITSFTLLPNFYEAAATAAALAKKYGADMTVVGGFQEFRLLEKLGEGSRPTAVIGEVTDDLSLDLVILSMKAIHSKHVDANLLAEFIPCPVLLLPL
ncbi:hypothetical protein Cgig2_019569 [Carnegiea gigantea]|uniref:Uncharacterized protein n=1 Tax=Carnegiea gigantea TaxID=171969 RepID=A0A9Q1KI05_9CARY|nr:hypothetical protein Cgig2_019569 [Carnegiea gigantea]